MKIRSRLSLIAFFTVLIAFRAASGYDDRPDFRSAGELLQTGRSADAAAVYREISVRSEDRESRARALLFLGYVLDVYLENPEDAIRQLDTLMRLYPESRSAPDALFASGMVRHHRGDFRRSAEAFEKYLETYPRGIRRESAETWLESARRALGTDYRPGRRAANPLIRVLVHQQADKISIRAENEVRIVDSVSGESIFRGAGLLSFGRSGDALTLNGKGIGATRCEIRSDRGLLSAEGKRYRGFFTLYTEADGIRAVNHLPLEEYLYGVVPAEISPAWPKEALMAQAIAARTYALYVRENNDGRPYDLDGSVVSQAYGGYDAEAEASTQAVDATRGKVITFQGKPIIACFHANSAGRTEDAREVWGVEIPYLKGIPDRFSEKIPGSEWEYFLPYQAAGKRLSLSDPNLRTIRGLQAIGKSASGRVRTVRIVSDAGTFDLTGNNFRLRIGGTELRSTFFEARSDSRGVRFRGKGYGHGVGMSQWGARRMAQSGYRHPDILKFYYQGIEITNDFR